MSLRETFVILIKDLRHGLKNFMIVFILVIPLALSLVVSLLFGTLFSQKPRLGIADQGDSQIKALAKKDTSIQVREFNSDQELRQAVENGAVDIGIALPAGFDQKVRASEQTELDAYLWGESLLKDRAILGMSLASLLRELAGHEAPVEVVTVMVGEGESLPWNVRLMPLLVFMGIVLSGSIIPAMSMVEEKMKRTLRALTISPASMGDVLAAKGLLGLLLSVTMGALMLAINDAWGNQPGLLLGVLLLSGAASAVFGVLMGALLKDMNTVFTIFKSMGIFLYAPALLLMFPEVPGWIAKIFPTYYMIAPLVEISQQGGSWSDIAVDIYVLLGIIALLVVLASLAARRMTNQEK